MTTLREAGVTALMGALELKRCYYRNLATAVLIILGSSAALFGILALLSSAAPPPPLDDGIVATADTFVVEFMPPPPTVEPPTRIAPPAPPPLKEDKVLTDIFEVVPDSTLIPVDPLLPTEDDLKKKIGDGGNGGSDISGVDMADVGATYVPPPDTFIAVEEHPEALQLIAPDYPSIAKRAGIEGSVWVKVLLDLDGSVMDAIIVKESGANAGFEEAALAAARKGKWRPGMQNSHPVRVWVAYEIKFRLR